MAKDFLRGSRPKAPAPTGAPDEGGEGQEAGGLTQRGGRREDEASHITNHKSQLSKMSFQPDESGGSEK